MSDTVKPLDKEQHDLIEEILSDIRSKLWVNEDLSTIEPSNIFVPEVYDVK